MDDRLRGIQDALKDKNLKWQVVVTGNEPEKAVETLAHQLKADSEIKAVLGTGLTDTEAAGVVTKNDAKRVMELTGKKYR